MGTNHFRGNQQRFRGNGPTTHHNRGPCPPFRHGANQNNQQFTDGIFTDFSQPITGSNSPGGHVADNFSHSMGPGSAPNQPITGGSQGINNPDQNGPGRNSHGAPPRQQFQRNMGRRVNPFIAPNQHQHIMTSNNQMQQRRQFPPQHQWRNAPHGQFRGSGSPPFNAVNPHFQVRPMGADNLAAIHNPTVGGAIINIDLGNVRVPLPIVNAPERFMCPPNQQPTFPRPHMDQSGINPFFRPNLVSPHNPAGLSTPQPPPSWGNSTWSAPANIRAPNPGYSFPAPSQLESPIIIQQREEQRIHEFGIRSQGGIAPYPEYPGHVHPSVNVNPGFPSGTIHKEAFESANCKSKKDLELDAKFEAFERFLNRKSSKPERRDREDDKWSRSQEYSDIPSESSLKRKYDHSPRDDFRDRIEEKRNMVSKIVKINCSNTNCVNVFLTLTL